MRKLPISVVIPTIGRSSLLKACLASIALCTPAVSEIVVVDQSNGSEVTELVADANDDDDDGNGPTVRRVTSEPGCIAHGLNIGLRAAQSEYIMVTNDDMTVAPDWTTRAWEAVEADPGGLTTGRVLPVGDATRVPSLRLETEPTDLTGSDPHRCLNGFLAGGNFVASRDGLQAIGGWDERYSFRIAAEDTDLCFRWALSGRALRFDPSLCVYHHDWRTPDEMKERFHTYALGQGALYAKHWAQGDRTMLRYFALDVKAGVGGLVRSTLQHRLTQPDEARSKLLGVPAGFVRGWLEERRLRGRGL